MLSMSQRAVIKEQLQKGNVKEFVETLILEYASDVNRTPELLGFIPKLAEILLRIEHNKTIENSQAVDMLISEIYHKKKSKDFVTLLYTSKTRFPSCNCNGGSPNHRELFNEFVTRLKTKDGFDYNSANDWNWLCNVVGYREWMISFIKLNVDETFKEPVINDA